MVTVFRNDQIRINWEGNVACNIFTTSGWAARACTIIWGDYPHSVVLYCSIIDRKILIVIIRLTDPRGIGIYIILSWLSHLQARACLAII